jgi:Ca-activated chloride channel family protein
MNNSDIIFEYPYSSLLLLLLIPLLFGFIGLHFHRKKQSEEFSSTETLKQLLTPRSPLLTYTKWCVWVIIWTLCCIALMSPIGNLRYRPLANPAVKALAKPHYLPHEVLFVVDTSASMGVTDGYDSTTRLNEAKSIMTDIISQLKGQTASLYAFTSSLSQLAPPTVDYLFLRLMIRELHLDEGDVGGTSFAAALESLSEGAFQKPSLKHYSVIFLSDGGDNQLDLLQGREREEEVKRIINAIPDPAQFNIRFYTVGIGSSKRQQIPHVTNEEGKPVESALEPEILEQLAKRNRGKYYQADQWSSWSLSREIASQIGQDPLISAQDGRPARQVTSIKQEDLIFDLYYQIPLGMALLFFFLNLLLPDVRR